MPVSKFMGFISSPACERLEDMDRYINSELPL